VVFDTRAALVFGVDGILLLDGDELVGNDGRDTLGASQNIQQIRNRFHDVAVFFGNFLLLKPRQALQAHVQNFLRLGIAEAIHAIGLQAIFFWKAFGAERDAAAGGVALVGAFKHAA